MNLDSKRLIQSLQVSDGQHHFKDLPRETFAILSRMSPENQKALGINVPLHFSGDEFGNPMNSVSTTALHSLYYWAAQQERKQELPTEGIQDRIRMAFQRFFPSDHFPHPDEIVA